MSEIYKDIENYEGIYQVSNLGNIKSLRSGKILKLRNHTSGYYQACLSVNNIQKYFFIHRLVVATFGSYEDMDNLVVNHINGNKKDNNIMNLELVTQRENIMHAIENSYHKVKGEDSYFSKLVWKQVKEIRKLYKKDFSLRDLAIKYNVSKATISRIVNKKIWIEAY